MYVDVEEMETKTFYVDTVCVCVLCKNMSQNNDEMSSSGNTISSYRDTSYLVTRVDTEKDNNWHFIIWSR